MKKTKQILALLFIGLSFCLASCSDENDPNVSNENNLSSGLFVLCEGNWGMNNSALDFYSKEKNSITLDLFNNINSQGLGDTGNDMVEFGDYIFISVKESACVNAINKNTGKLAKRIPILNSEGQSRMPSRLCSSSTMVYLCTFDGNVVEINPNTLSIGRIAKVGRNPEDLTYANGKLYVTNSGGLDYNTAIGYDKTVSVVDPINMTEIKKIEVGLNPCFIKTINDGLVGLIVKGNYNDVPCSFVTINTVTDEIDKKNNIGMSNFDVIGNNILYVNYDWVSMSASIKTFDYSTSTINSTDFIKTSGILEQFTTPYGVNVSNSNNEVYITDATSYTSSGKVFVFNTDGDYKYSFSTSNIPSVVIPR